MPSGVLWVSSRIKKPGLTPEKFCSWYENQHIGEVTALSGVPRAARYERYAPSPFPNAWSDEAPWLTVYEMPDIEFRQTKEFKGLDGQSEPIKELLEGVFKLARFDTRFYECVQVDEKEGTANGPARILVSAALTPAAGTDAEFDKWYRDEHVPILSKIPGYRRTRRFKVVNATVLDEFVRREPPVPTWLALHEFDTEDVPIKEMIQADETEWSKKIIAGFQMVEAGFYRLKRTYDTENEAKL